MGYPILDWNDEWIRANSERFDSITVMWDYYQKETGHMCKRESFRTHVDRKFNLHSGLSWTKEEEAWLRENFPRLGLKKSAIEFEKQFGKKKSVNAIRSYANKRGIYVDEDAKIANANYSRRVPIGTIVDDGDGYLKIKVGPEYSSSGWVRYHRYLYEQKHGKIPRGYKIMFLDGDKRNYSDENMVAIPASYFALMNKLNLHSEFPEINFAGIQWCELYSALKKKGYRLRRGKFIRDLEGEFE